MSNGLTQIQVRPVQLVWLDQTDSTVNGKLRDGDLTIIKSHAMRAIHREKHINRKSSPRKKARTRTKAHVLLPVPSPNWEDVALCKFFDDHVFPEQISCANAFRYPSFLSALYDKNARDSHLTQVVSAVSLAYLAGQRRDERLVALGRNAYFKAVTLVTAAMSDDEEAKSDQVLATVLLLGKYEENFGDVKLERWHRQGQAALVFKRGPEQFKSEIGLSMFRLMLVTQQMTCLEQATHPPHDYENCGPALPTHAMSRLFALNQRIMYVRADTRDVLTESVKDMSQVGQLAQEAQSIDAEMLMLRKYIPRDLVLTTIPPSSICPHASLKQKDEYVPNCIYTFKELYGASFWHLYWYGQLYLLQTLLQHASIPLGSSIQQSMSRAVLRIRLLDVVDSICNSIPAILGEIDDGRLFNTASKGKAVGAHYAVWLLAAALTVDDIPAAQRAWIIERLVRIGHEQGLRKALEFV